MAANAVGPDVAGLPAAMAWIIQGTILPFRELHCGDKVVIKSSYLHSGNSYTGKMVSLCWIKARMAMSSLWKISAAFPIQMWINYVKYRYNVYNIYICIYHQCNSACKMLKLIGLQTKAHGVTQLNKLSFWPALLMLVISSDY